MKRTSEECATISVDNTQTVDLNKDFSMKSEEPAITVKALPKIEVAPEDKIFVYASSNFLVFLRFLKSLKIEVLILVYMFAYVIRSVTTTTMIMHKVCVVNIGFSGEVCANLELDMYKEQKRRVETVTNNYHLFHTLIGLTPSAVLACFVGPWSDMYGRRVPIIAAFIGVILDGIGAVVCAYFLDTGAQYFLIPAIFSGLSGGMISVMTVVYSYASDITPPKSRTFKYTMIEIAMGLGVPLGTLVGGWTFKYFGYLAVFGTSVAGHVLGLIWILFLIEETRGLDNHDRWEVKVRNFITLDRFLESFRACMKRRPHRGRLQIWLLLMSMSVCFLALMGTTNIAYLYTYHHYSWSNTKYSTVSSIYSVMGFIAMLIGVPLLTRVLKVGDPILGIIGCVASLIKYTGISLAAKEGVYYFASLFGLLSGMSTLAGRARMSKIVSKNDLGKVFAFLSTVESLLPIAASAIVSQLFNATVGVFPDPSYLGISIVLVVPLSVYAWIACLPTVNYEEMDDSEKTEDPESASKELS